MLSLTRHAGEELVFYKDGVEIGSIKVIEATGGKLRVGLAFQPDIKIYRREMLLGEQPKVVTK